MSNAKSEVEKLMQTLPDDCSIEDIQYHLYVVEKIKRGIERAETEDTLSQEFDSSIGVPLFNDSS